ncbi:MAG: hypothetical protein Q8O76_14090, partial [Chloroflexota bacterium]|nr:hypothetical protein [Chloroflexota bacterium]
YGTPYETKYADWINQMRDALGGLGSGYSLEIIAGILDEAPGFDENSPGQFSTTYQAFLKKLNDALGGGHE